MDPIYEIELQDCPYCRGTGTVEDEQGWGVYVTCVDCGAQTAHEATSPPRNVWPPRSRSRTCGTSARF